MRFATFVAVAVALSLSSASALAQYGPWRAPEIAAPVTHETGFPASGAPVPPGGAFTVLTYNVAGIPEPFNFGRPDIAQARISPRLNAYDLVLVQEDFAFHGALAAAAGHAFRSPPMRSAPRLFALGDGLTTFSRLGVELFERQTWERCSGLFSRMADCIADKGYTFAVVRLPDGARIHVYNVHFDAGSAEGDLEARRIQTDQLIEAIRVRSDGRAVIVAGDTNMRPGRRQADADNIARLMGELDLADACEALDCGVERIDRVLYRSGGGVVLEPQQYNVPGNFVYPDGEPLSDHPAISVRFRWDTLPDADGVARGEAP